MLRYKGAELELFADPLYPKLSKMKKARRPRFVSNRTSCHRGYVGTWEFRDDMLTLVSIDGDIWIGGEDSRAATLADISPRHPEGIPATWVYGELACPEGRMIEAVHMGFERSRPPSWCSSRLA